MNNYTQIKFEVPPFDAASFLAEIYALRDNMTCDSTVLDTFIWKGHYKTKIYAEESAALLIMEDEEGFFSAMPYCKQEELPQYFQLLKDYFNHVLNTPLRILLADEDALNALELMNNPEYIIKEEEDLKDYLYSAEELRTLAGKKFQKKRNLVNKFLKEYEGRWEYKTLCCSDEAYLESFLDKWVKEKLAEGTDNEAALLDERKGILDILRNCDKMTFRIGALFIDDALEAFTIGSYNPRNKMVVVSIEKGNPEFTGIYQMINQQYLLNSFPDVEVEIVNREDDMGLEGLRRAKESYNPIGFARKYMVIQKNV